MTMAEMSMLEKVARALDPSAFRQFESMRDYCRHIGDDDAEALKTAEWAHGGDVKRAKEKARAAIEAMREPTEAMEDAAFAKTLTIPNGAYTAMIDAALSEEVAG